MDMMTDTKPSARLIHCLVLKDELHLYLQSTKKGSINYLDMRDTRGERLLQSIGRKKNHFRSCDEQEVGTKGGSIDWKVKGFFSLSRERVCILYESFNRVRHYLEY